VNAPKDKRGRSFKQLDLKKRLLQYPCSYMIYSRAFDGLPGSAKDAVYARMWAILSGKEKSSKYAKLPLADRTAIVDVLWTRKRVYLHIPAAGKIVSHWSEYVRAS